MAAPETSWLYDRRVSYQRRTDTVPTRNFKIRGGARRAPSASQAGAPTFCGESPLLLSIEVLPLCKELFLPLSLDISQISRLSNRNERIGAQQIYQ
jgi:hypothetical protein